MKFSLMNLEVKISYTIDDYPGYIFGIDYDDKGNKILVFSKGGKALRVGKFLGSINPNEEIFNAVV